MQQNESEEESQVNSLEQNLQYPRVSTPNGSRTRAACLEGKHDNRFTIGVTSSCRMTLILRNSTVTVCEPLSSLKNILQYWDYSIQYKKKGGNIKCVDGTAHADPSPPPSPRTLSSAGVTQQHARLSSPQLACPENQYPNTPAVLARAPTGHDVATLPAGVHSPLQHKYLSPRRVLPLSQIFRNRGTLPTRTQQGWAKTAYVKEASSIVALQDAVGAVPQQHTTTTTVRMEHRDGRRVVGHLPHNIPHIR